VIEHDPRADLPHPDPKAVQDDNLIAAGRLLDVHVDVVVS
jgi:hypothetical protein